MSDEPSVTLTGPRPDWMPHCDHCHKQVEGVIVRNANGITIYTASCHGDTSSIARVQQTDDHVNEVEQVWLKRFWNPFSAGN